MKHVAFLTLFSLSSVVAGGDKEPLVFKAEKYIFVAEWINSVPDEGHPTRSGSVSPVSVTAVTAVVCKPGLLKRSTGCRNLCNAAGWEQLQNIDFSKLKQGYN